MGLCWIYASVWEEMTLPGESARALGGHLPIYRHCLYFLWLDSIWGRLCLSFRFVSSSSPFGTAGGRPKSQHQTVFYLVGAGRGSCRIFFSFGLLFWFNALRQMTQPNLAIHSSFSVEPWISYVYRFVFPFLSLSFQFLPLPPSLANILSTMFKRSENSK